MSLREVAVQAALSGLLELIEALGVREVVLDIRRQIATIIDPDSSDEAKTRSRERLRELLTRQ